MSASRLSVTRVVVGLRVRRSTFPLLETACRVDFAAPAAQRKSGLVLLSRDSLFAQRIAISFCVQVGDGTVDSGVEGVGIGIRLVGEIKGFEVMPDHFDVVELWRILGSHSTVSQWA